MRNRARMLRRFVIGSRTRSNTTALARLAHDAVCPRVFESTSKANSQPIWRHDHGVTAGASAPEALVEAVIAKLAPTNGVEEVRITDEDEYFPPPRNLRDLLTAIDVAATIGFGGTLRTSPAVNDRQLHASDVLAALA